MKKLLAGALALVVFAGCSSGTESSNNAVSSITLKLETSECYKGKPIEISMDVDSDYQLTEDDFNVFGGTIEIEDKDTAYVTYNSAGTFHVSCQVDDVESNELTITVHTNTSSGSSSSSSTSKNSSSSSKSSSSTSSSSKTKDKDDYSDWENVRDASDDKVTSADDVYNNSSSYAGQTIIMEGTIPSDSDGTYMVTSDGQKIQLSGLEMNYAGTVRVYGTFDGSTFDVQTYCAFSSETLNKDANNTDENQDQ